MRNLIVAICSAFLFLSPFAVTAGEVGIPGKGGTPEQLFLDTVSPDEAPATAEMIATALAKGRLIIFSHMKKLTDPELGDKGFTGDYFAEHWMAALEPELITATPAQKRILEKLVWAGKQSIDNNQDRLNKKGVGWKNFLPAKWARETGVAFTARTGIVTKQPARNYRSPGNAPDPYEKEVLESMTRADFDGEARGQFMTMGKQKVYRYFQPVQLIQPCLSCHGKPKGELDVLGFQKDGLEAGDVIGMISVTVGVDE